MHSDERVRVRNCVLKFKSICYKKEIIARELQESVRMSSRRNEL
jgi:hypothetical protein